jgi:hypothetical protein
MARTNAPVTTTAVLAALYAAWHFTGGDSDQAAPNAARHANRTGDDTSTAGSQLRPVKR